MKISKKHLICLCLLVATLFAPRLHAQELVWDASMDFFFDNREYKSQINWPQTLFGMHITPELGVRFEERHTLMIGYDMLARFGTKPFTTDNEIIAYYQYHSPKFKAYAGIVPRRKLIGEYSPAFISDSVRHFDPNISGLALQYVGDHGYVEFAADWNSMWAADTREKFLLLSSGRYNFRQGLLYGGYNLSMYHHAGNFTEDGVVDNVLIYPFAGLNLATQCDRWQELSLQVGWMNGFQNDRKFVGEYVTPGGAQIELRLQRWNFGVHNTLYLGDNLMPYYEGAPELDYGPGLYWGEPFYRTSNVYDRLEIYWQPIQTQRMSLRVASVHHYDGKIWGWQQQLLFSVTLGQNKMFKKRQ